MRKIFLLLIAICFTLLFQSCFFERSNPNVPYFYKAKGWGQWPRLPLAYPLRMLEYEIDSGWSIELFQFEGFDNGMFIGPVSYIGVEKQYVYGNLSSGIVNVDDHPEDYVYSKKYGGLSYSETTGEINADKKELVKFFNKKGESHVVIPETYFFVNTQDSTLQVFFSEEKYLQELKDNNISGKMYNLDSVQNIFLETDILPWFPDSIKAEINKR